MFAGYQAVGTPGRCILDGAESVKLFGEEIEVKAEITKLQGVSGHADDNGLMEWISAMTEKPQMVFVTHGDDKVTEFFRDRLINERGLKAYAPFSGTIFNLATGEFEYEAEPVPVEKEEREALAQVREDGGAVVRKKGSDRGAAVNVTSKNKKAAAIYTRLVQAGNRLLLAIRHNEGGANKDLKRMTEEINRLIERWDR